MIPCLGGFCTQRDRCAHYYAESLIPAAERLCGAKEEPVFFRQYDRKLFEIEQTRGKNLACWCPTDAPCHAEVLLVMANVQVRGAVCASLWTVWLYGG